MCCKAFCSARHGFSWQCTPCLPAPVSQPHAALLWEGSSPAWVGSEGKPLPGSLPVSSGSVRFLQNHSCLSSEALLCPEKEGEKTNTEAGAPLNLILPLQILGVLSTAQGRCRSSGCSLWLPKPHLKQLLPFPPSLPPLATFTAQHASEVWLWKNKLAGLAGGQVGTSWWIMSPLHSPEDRSPWLCPMAWGLFGIRAQSIPTAAAGRGWHSTSLVSTKLSSLLCASQELVLR